MSDLALDASVISSLTQKIQSGFESGTKSRKKAGSSSKSAPKSGSISATASTESHGQSSKSQKRKRNDDREYSKGGTAHRSANGNGFQRHESRDAVPKASPAKKARSDRSQPTKKNNRDQSSGQSKKNDSPDLRKIVAELGGDDEDMKLIEDAGSESELEGQDDAEQSESLKKDIQNMIKALGIPQAQPVGGDTSEEEDEAVINEDGDDEDVADGAGHAARNGADEDGESDIDDLHEQEPQLISQVKQALEKLPERKRPNMKGLLVNPQSEWHSIPIPGISASAGGSTQLHPETLEMLHDYAKELLQQENEKYATVNKTSNSANQFYSTIMASGTLSDKISALTLSAQESPLHNVQTLESLVNLAKKRNRSQAVEVLGALKDLLGPGNLLPSNRRLRSFATQPALKFVNGQEAKSWHSQRPLPSPLTKTHLLVWAFEDWLKSSYFEILKILETWINDEIAYTRSKALGFVFELLRDKPEQEANLLRLLVNKLGDTDKQIASKTSYYILQIENAHPAMKPLIISSLESDLIFRQHQSNHAKYYGIVTLNQTVLSTREEQVARQLLNIYFSLFLEILKKPESGEDSKAVKVQKLNSKGDSQGGGSAPGKKAAKKAAAQARSEIAQDELREKMLSAVLTGVNRAMPYVDKGSDFFENHLDTLFRVTHSANFNTSIQALMLIQQLSGSHQAASNRFYRTLYESLLDPRLLTSNKQALYLNLLFRALRSDLSVRRVKAFVKRLLQVTAMQQPNFACAVIYLIRELEAVFPSLTALVDQAEADDSDGEEVFRDVPEESEDETAKQNKNEKSIQKTSYDGRKRDPEYANADASCLWELAPLQQHYHPSVSLFASSLTSHEKMPSKPDLSVNTLIHFLDRFVYRNPKKTAATGLRGHSLMQPLVGSGDTSSLLVTAKSRDTRTTAPVNTEGFKNKKQEAVEADEVFFHRYFNEIGKKTDKSKKSKEDKKKRQDEDDEVSGEENEDEIWQALVDSRPEIEGEDEGEDGWDDMDDFEEAMQDDDDEADAIDADEKLDDALDEEGEDDDEGFDFDDEDDLLGSEDELPDDFALASEQEEAKEQDDAPADKKKNKKADRRKMLKSLPMFASAEDYAAMLESEEEV